jgi:prepilin-type N-terminal cleavage/methylation domain-containing protein
MSGPVGAKVKKVPDSRTKNKAFPLNKGFTLVELMIAASILGMIALAILSSFDAGLRAFAHVQSFGGTQVEALLAIDRIERDLRNTFRLSGINFDGGAKEISFPAVVRRLDEEDNERVSLGRITYRFDSSQKALIVKEEDYSLAIAGGGGEAIEDSAQPKVPRSEQTAPEILAFIEDLHFDYYFYRKGTEGDKETVDYGWKASWAGKDDGFPRGVKVEVVFKNGQEERSLARTVFIPVGGETGEAGEGPQGGEGGE